MTISWWWVRHGPTHSKNLVGHTDIAADLSDVTKIEWLNNNLPESAELVSSDLLRAVATADLLGEKRKRLAHRKNLREINFGDWEDCSFAAVAKSNPDLSKEYWENPGDSAPPNGESWNSFSQRVRSEIDVLTQQTSQENIIVVAHFGVILAAIQQALGLHAKATFSFKINNLSITRLDRHDDDRWTIQHINQNN